MSNVKLAIRLRPFTDAEVSSERDGTQVVEVVNDNTVTITNLKVGVGSAGAGDSRQRVRRYLADYTYDSACDVTSTQHATQEKIFETLGRGVLSSVCSGVSCCVLCYGASATGKTHTMVGTDLQPGLLPSLCVELAANYPQLTVSFLEIYNERVHDLLAEEETPSNFNSLSHRQQGDCNSLSRRQQGTAGDSNSLSRRQQGDYNSLSRRQQGTAGDSNSLSRRQQQSSDLSLDRRFVSRRQQPLARKELRVREHPTKGPYVQNLSRVECTSESELLSAVRCGVTRRRTAATRRNAASSRSHALVQIATPHATLHLADLAGSETGECCGGRRTEGANINKSLVALSNVICALVTKSRGGCRYVPYRGSALTWLLRDCFTGGARTYIIATVSPSVACYGESASTLRWAERARQLPAASVRGKETAVIRATLQSQLDRLLAELNRNHIIYIPDTGKIIYEDSHWALHTSYTSKLDDTNCNEEKNIGNLMKMLQPQSKEDTQSTVESVASSAGSGSSDTIDAAIKNIDINKEVSSEIEKIFGPALERAKSGSDLQMVAPLRNKRRQFRSHEVLHDAKAFNYSNNQTPIDSSPMQSQLDIPNAQSGNVSHVPIIYDNNQRAEIVASVTERLYSKLKKKEETPMSKIENVVDKKIMEPLSELRICTNARQRLLELGSKAMRNKRRIGIPAHTQTKKIVIRVKDQGNDVQTDLESYTLKDEIFVVRRDAVTETMPATPRCKEISVGPKFGSISYKDTSTITEIKQVPKKSALVMTESLPKRDCYTQTMILPPPRSRRRICQHAKRENREDESISAPVISINISHAYNSESDSQNSDKQRNIIGVTDNKTNVVIMTPDLLANHSTTDISMHTLGQIYSHEKESLQQKNDTETDIGNKINDDVSPNISTPAHEEFSDSNDYLLPRVTVNSERKMNQDEMKEMILGRNEDTYPYNIIFSPPKVKESKRMVTFKDLNVKTDGRQSPSIKISETSSSDRECSRDSLASSISDSSTSSKVESGSFQWKSFSQNKSDRPRYSPVYKTNLRYKTAKARIYREFLGLDEKKYTSKVNTDYCCQADKDVSSSDSLEAEENSQDKFERRRQFFEEKFNHDMRNQRDFDIMARKLEEACNVLDGSVNAYQSYLRKSSYFPRTVEPARTPTKYLQHLVNLRREVVRADSDEMTTESSYGGFRR